MKDRSSSLDFDNDNLEKVLLKMDAELRDEQLNGGNSSNKRVRFTTAAKTQDTEDKLFRMHDSD